MRVGPSRHRSEDDIVEHRSRLRLVVSNRIREATSWTAGPPGHRDLAVSATAAGKGPVLVEPFGTNYPGHGEISGAGLHDRTGSRRSSSIEDHPDVVERLTSFREARFTTAGGARLRWSHTAERVVFGLGNRRFPLAVAADARVPPDGRVCPPAQVIALRDNSGPLRTALLLSPLALSGIFLPLLTKALTRRCGEHTHRPDTISEAGYFGDIIDDGAGPPTDLEGTRRRRMTLTAPVVTIMTRGGHGELTGHAGFQGVEFENLSVGSPDAEHGVPRQAAHHLVAQARPLPGMPGLIAFTMAACRGRPSTAIVDLPDPGRLLHAGRWIAPIQAGNGAWRSPWLELARPGDVLSVVHVEDMR
ncbi:hypothetical protein [Amycolatopsis pigmentata]|uniref:Uncharacterized protein n=1 Tax=Amycolatopsis pigmentata TaxID=450801 RepID=A0ABW5FS28_9PSEU